MNELNIALDRDLTAMAALKSDLEGVEDLLEERPVDPNNILATLSQRESQIEELQTMLPKLKMFDTHRLTMRMQSLNNDQLFKAFVTAFEVQNTDLTEFRKLSTQEIKGKKELKKKADVLARIALK